MVCHPSMAGEGTEPDIPVSESGARNGKPGISRSIASSQAGEGAEPDIPVSESVTRNGKPEIERKDY
jgi:hypothetical protein